MEITIEVHNGGIHHIHTAKFERGRMISTKTICWNNGGQEWIMRQDHHQLTEWQRTVGVDEYIADKLYDD